ncbi:MAG: TetR family transcriptional regulator [Hyphomonadaceae bacterium]
MPGPKIQNDTEAGGERDAQAVGMDRFERRRADIIAAAIPVLNSHGFKGMRLTSVAELIGLRATGVTYYFPRKEELAVACLESGFTIFHGLLDEAEQAPDAASRIARLIALFVARDAAVRRGEVVELASFSAIRALEGELREQVAQGYALLFRRVRALLDTPELVHVDKTGKTIQALVLLEQLYWANIWLGDFELEHFPRLARRMTDIVVNGMMPKDVAIVLGDLDLRTTIAPADAAKENFLIAATRQINEHGYRGASVDRISAALNVTKGAFYHHNEAKDDLVAACFRRSFGIAREAQRRVASMPGTEMERLSAAVAGLIRFQMGPEGPLLRTSVLSSMPQEHQVEIIAQSHKVSRQFSAMIADAVADGSARPVDPAVAGALLLAAINVASDMRIETLGRDADIVGRFVQTLIGGLPAR